MDQRLTWNEDFDALAKSYAISKRDERVESLHRLIEAPDLAEVYGDDGFGLKGYLGRERQRADKTYSSRTFWGKDWYGHASEHYSGEGSRYFNGSGAADDFIAIACAWVLRNRKPVRIDLGQLVFSSSDKKYFRNQDILFGSYRYKEFLNELKRYTSSDIRPREEITVLDPKIQKQWDNNGKKYYTQAAHATCVLELAQSEATEAQLPYHLLQLQRTVRSLVLELDQSKASAARLSYSTPFFFDLKDHLSSKIADRMHSSIVEELLEHPKTYLLNGNYYVYISADGFERCDKYNIERHGFPENRQVPSMEELFTLACVLEARTPWYVSAVCPDFIVMSRVYPKPEPETVAKRSFFE
ncbi:hypothetical protein [Gordonibacter massiliensis (ex Traore et al. 2017)]|uniref:Uncharacterized protein n=1 Tax=Gordonibacter massiliensis (ex Traore et al. 2017) TaxID=1841863 RepID=A0A842JC70_9ACTN|nr:hypothetical protein [Gordonibacter massiliensis (ex Traore et al. 2017)]MBC2888446.1 hypothetical protein [Gordonibacter massiliensis (ex Traore et al. 2017)]